MAELNVGFESLLQILEKSTASRILLSRPLIKNDER